MATVPATAFDSYPQVVERIWDIVQNDEKLETFDFIPPKQVPEEIAFPLKYEDHNIGLECWCVKPLFLFIYPKLLQKTLDVENRKAFLTTALLLNSDVKTFWNMRRELVLQNQLDVSVELRYVNLVLSSWQKCSDAIHYRKWLLRDELTDKPLEFLVSELNRIHEMADHHMTNNHLLWDYCVWLQDESQNHLEFANFTHVAWHLSGQYMSTHPSDASHFFYRQQIVRHTIQDRGKLKDLFLKVAKDTAVKEDFTNFNEDDSYVIGIIVYEFSLNADLIEFYTNHEGIWCYRRFLIWCWLNDVPKLVSHQGKCRMQELANSTTDGCPFKSYFFNRLQPKFLSKITKNDSYYTQRYRKWINSYV